MCHRSIDSIRRGDRGYGVHMKSGCRHPRSDTAFLTEITSVSWSQFERLGSSCAFPTCSGSFRSCCKQGDNGSATTWLGPGLTRRPPPDHPPAQCPGPRPVWDSCNRHSTVRSVRTALQYFMLELEAWKVGHRPEGPPHIPPQILESSLPAWLAPGSHLGLWDRRRVGYPRAQERFL